MRSTFGKTVTELAKKDKKIVVLVGDISHGLFSDLRKLPMKDILIWNPMNNL